MRDRALISLMLDTGIRLAECCALDLSDVDEAQGTLLVRMGKGAKQRMVVFESATRAALQAWIAARAGRAPQDPCALFVNYESGKRLTRSGLYKAVKAVAASAGLESVVSPHRLRHTFATLYLDNGGALQDVSQLMGHTHIATTMIYTHVATAGLRRKHRAVSPLNALTR